MFDSSSEIKVDLWSDTGRRELKIRWPSDQEWEDRYVARKILIKRLGRGISETTIDTEAADAKLYSTIKLNGADPVSTAEAHRVIDTIAACTVNGVEIQGGEADVELEVMGGIVHHHLKIPSAEQIIKLDKSTRVLNLPYNVQQLRIGVAAGAAAWDASGGRSADYQGIVPAIHKDAAVRAVIDHINREMSSPHDESSF